MPKILKFSSLVFVSILFLIILVSPVKAVTLAEQTQEYSSSLNVWQMIQELGSDLEGPLKSFTFRVHTTLPRNLQFDFTAINSRIYDKTTKTLVVPYGCVPPKSSSDRLAGLTFTTDGVPAGFEDVTLNFSCHNFSFIKGHRYLIHLSNANMAAFGGMRMLLASTAYGITGQDFFPFGGLRYAFDNKSCSASNYVWNSQTASAGCNIWTAPADDLYFILSDTTPEPTPTPTPTPVPTKTPLILIPGIGGSELKVGEDTIWNKDNGHGGEFNHIYPVGEKVWVNEGEAANPGDDDYFDVLRMQDDGVTSEANIGLTGNLYAGAYQPAIDFFTANGYTLNQDFFVFPYDWRKDINHTKDLLDQKISHIKTQTGAQKVDIVAHSMGGLVARNYIADPTKAQNIRKLFTLGTPHLGSPDYLKNLRFGGCLRFEVGPFCLSFAPTEVKDVIQNMISGFQLATSQAYFNFYSNEDNEHPYPYRTEAGALNYSQIKNFLTTLGHNTALFDPSETFHSIDSILSNTNGADVVVIAGSGQPTLGQIIEEKTTSLLGIQGVHKDVRIINGDETVPLFSASLNDPSKNLSYLGTAKIYYTNQKHSNLVTNGSALNLVKNILEENNNLPEGVSAQPYSLPLNWLLSVHSPVNIHVYDSSGNHTGPTIEGFEANIPGSSYDILGDAKFIYLPENGVYDIKFEATNNGSFDFKIRKFEDDENTETILYNDVPLTNNTKAETTFDSSSSNPPVLQIDQDGNGTADKQASASATLTGDQNFDRIAPKTEVKITGTKGLNDYFTSDVKLELSVTNEASGSGVLKIEYTLNNNQTVQTYNEPFTISNEGITKIKFRSIDNAGNEEAAQEIEIKIDKTAPEAKIFVDQNTKDLILQSMDASGSAIQRSDNTITKRKDDAIYKITDSAGNSLKLNVIETNKQNQDKFRITSMQYNNDLPKTPVINQFNIDYQMKKKQIDYIKEQSLDLKGEININIQYDPKKNRGTITLRRPKQKAVKEMRNGIILLQLKTNKGKLEATY